MRIGDRYGLGHGGRERGDALSERPLLGAGLADGGLDIGDVAADQLDLPAQSLDLGHGGGRRRLKARHEVRPRKHDPQVGRGRCGEQDPGQRGAGNAAPRRGRRAVVRRRGEPLRRQRGLDAGERLGRMGRRGHGLGAEARRERRRRRQMLVGMQGHAQKPSTGWEFA